MTPPLRVPVSPAVESLLASLTVDEKAALTAGSDGWHTTGLPDRGVGRVKVTDGPTGARGDGASGATATCFPVGVSLGASWDVDLLNEIGAALAGEARSKGAQVLLGPTVNLQRTPLGGRNFESYSEDPLLTARLAVAFVRGLQANGVGACIKHFVANDVEFDRHEVSADLDDVTLREVALLPFELAVREADPWSVMSAYNRLNGETCSASRRLLTEILKDEWKWPGAVISDWGAVKDTVATADAGNDLEMPGPGRWLGARLADAVRSGDVAEEQLDELARRMLHLAERAGRIGRMEEPRETSVDDPALRDLARRAAVGGIVLLRNERQALPLEPGTLRRVAVIGPNVEGFMIQGGGSSQVQPHAEVVGPLEALLAALGPSVEVVHEIGCRNGKFAPAVPDEQWAGASEEVRGRRPPVSTFVVARRREDGPVLVEMWDGVDFDGQPSWSYRADSMSTAWFGRIRRVPGDRISGRLTGRFVPATGGVHEFGLSAIGRSRLFVDGELIVDNWTDPQPGDTFFANGSAEARGSVALHAGREVEVVVEFARERAAEMAGVRVGVLVSDEGDPVARAVEAARSADAVVVIVGTTAEWETEGNDRRDMVLPGRQSELVAAVAAANERTVVVVNTGSPVEMPWAADVPAIVQAWFGGQEMGPALAAVLTGGADPGGRLPHTMPMRLEDHPAAGWYPGIDGHLPYREGTRCGHRWYDDQRIEPRFPFGHGLSYGVTTWGAAAVEVTSAAVTGPLVEIAVPLRNNGERAATAVVQVYVARDTASPSGNELKGFAKITLAPASEAVATVTLDGDAFRRWDAASAAWVVDPGTYGISVGASSRDLRSTATVELTA